jgi:hypothetical protein
MSRDSKYIGMDGSGKLMMECVIENQGSSILQFIYGLRSERPLKVPESARLTLLLC